MKYTVAALGLVSALALPAPAIFAVVWHGVAHPGGLPADQHDGFGSSEGEVAGNAVFECDAGYGAGKCVVSLGHVDHH